MEHFPPTRHAYWKRTHSCGVWVSSGVLSYKCSADMAMSSSSFGPVGPLGLPALLVLPDCTDYDLGADKLHLPRDLGDVWRSRKTACPVHPAVCNSFGTRLCDLLPAYPYFFQTSETFEKMLAQLPPELVTLIALQCNDTTDGFANRCALRGSATVARHIPVLPCVRGTTELDVSDLLLPDMCMCVE